MRKDITGQIVAYATSPEMYALDGDRGASSPYTNALLSELQMPDVSLWAALSKASAQVVRKTDGGQRPFISSDMNGDLYFLRPSPTRKMRALVIGAGRVDSLNIASLSGPVADAAAWHHFLAQSGFEVITLGNPTRADVMGEIERLRIASLGGPNLSIRRVGFVVEEGAGKAREPSLAPPPDTLAVFVFSGYGLRTQFDRFLILADARSTSAESPQNVITSTLLSMAELEQRLREVASASVLIVDTAFTQVDSTTQHGKNALPLK